MRQFLSAVAVVLTASVGVMAHRGVEPKDAVFESDDCTTLFSGNNCTGKVIEACIDSDDGSIWICGDNDGDGTFQFEQDDVTINAVTTIKDDGTPLTKRSILNFLGPTLVCADDAVTPETDCTISAAPDDATFCVVSPDGDLSAEQQIGVGTGLDVANCTTTLDFSELSLFGGSPDDAEEIIIRETGGSTETPFRLAWAGHVTSTAIADGAVASDDLADWKDAAPLSFVGDDWAVPCIDVWGPDTNGDGDPDADGTCEAFFNGHTFVTRNGSPFFSQRPTIITLTAGDLHGENGTPGLGDGDATYCEDPADFSDDIHWGMCEARDKAVRVSWPVVRDKRCFDDTTPGDGCPTECFNADHDSDGTAECFYGISDKAADLMADWNQAIETHGSAHCGVVIDGASQLWSLAPTVNTTTGAYSTTGNSRPFAGALTNDPDEDGVVEILWDIVEGSATLTGDPIEGQQIGFDPYCLSDDRYAPPGAWVGIDCDGVANTIEWESYIAGHVDTDGTASNKYEQLTIADAVPSDCDGDGTTGETFNQRPVYIRSNWRTTYNELQASTDSLESGSSEGISVLAGQAPGPWEESPWFANALVSSGIEGATDPSPGNNTGNKAAGMPGSIQLNRVSIACNDGAGSMTKLFARVIGDRLPYVNFWSHRPLPDADAACVAGDGNWSRTLWTEALDECVACMRAGTCYCTDVATGTRLNSIWGDTMSHRNLISNPWLEAITELADNDAGAEAFWPWYSASAGLDLDGTAAFLHENPCSTQPCEDRRTVWHADDTGANINVNQSIFVDKPGWYSIRLAVAVQGFIDTDGFRAEIRRKPDDQESTNDYSNVFRTRWYVSPKSDLASATEDGFDSLTHMSHEEIDSDYDGDGTPDGIKEREIVGLFYVDPFEVGAEVELRLWIIGGENGNTSQGGTADTIDNDGDGTVDESDRVYFLDEISVLYHPALRDADVSGAGRQMLPRLFGSYIGHTVIAGDGRNDAAFNLEWQPSADTDANAIVDNPNRFSVLMKSPTDGDVNFNRWGVTGSGAGVFRGMCLLDQDANDDGTRDEGDDFLDRDQDLAGDTDISCISYDDATDEFYKDDDADGVRDAGELDLIGGTDIVAWDFYREDIFATSFAYMFSNADINGTQDMFHRSLPWAATIKTVSCHMENADPTTSGITLRVQYWNTTSSTTNVWTTTEFVTTTSRRVTQSENCTSGCSIPAGFPVSLQYQLNGSFAPTSSIELGCTLWLEVTVP